MAFELNTAPTLLTIEEVAATLKRSRETTRAFIWRELVKLGGVVKTGRTLMVHAWCLNKWLQERTLPKTHPKVAKQQAEYERVKQAAIRRQREHPTRKKTGRPFKPRHLMTPEEIAKFYPEKKEEEDA